MTDAGIGDYFISDVDEGYDEDGDISAAPVVVPVAPAVSYTPVAPAVSYTPAAPAVSYTPAEPVAPPAMYTPAVPPASYMPATPAVSYAPTTQTAMPVAPEPAAPIPGSVVSPVPRPGSVVPTANREERLVRALDSLMEHSPGVQAAALVSLDGFTMASALPEGMQEDRVGAMSAAILGLGERAAAELGRGHLSQVFIEGADGYVLLMAAGDRAVLTVLADADGKLGLIIYDMRQTAAEIGETLR